MVLEEVFMIVSASALRQNIFKLLDEVLETGKPLRIRRKGKYLTIVPAAPADKFKNLKKRKIMVGDPEDFVHLDWSGEWKP
jgi:prevent-host-death family protein